MKNETLEVVRLANNSFGVEGATDLLKLLRLNKRIPIKEIDLTVSVTLVLLL